MGHCLLRAADRRTGGGGMIDLPLTVPHHWDSPEGREIAVEYSTLLRNQIGHSALSDFALANAVFLVGRDDLRLINFQTSAKERIRWLSVQLAIANAENERLKRSCEGINPDAVPELFEACEGLVAATSEYLNTGSDQSGYAAMIYAMREAVAKARAAIAKARNQ